MRILPTRKSDREASDRPFDRDPLWKESAWVIVAHRRDDPTFGFALGTRWLEPRAVTCRSPVLVGLDPVALKIIGAGFGRTGTLSLKTALEQLGFDKCHHMQEVPGSPEQIEAWHRLAHGGTVDWDRVFDGFQASCDWPSCSYWEQLYDHYPDSKVILTVRDEERWYDSVAETIYPVAGSIPKWLMVLIPRLKRLNELIVTGVWNGVFDGKFEDRAHAISVFRENSARVKRIVDPGRLLVFEAKDGWQPLCAFLGVPVPDTHYPHVNEAAVVKRLVRVLRALRWVPWVLLGVLVWVLIGSPR